MIMGTNNTGVTGTAGQAGPINLSKGAKINLSKSGAGQKPLTDITVGLGWTTNKYTGGDDLDLDASVFMQDQNGRTTEAGFVFYNNLNGINGSVIHMGDNRVGGDGVDDDEQIHVMLDKVPDFIQKIAVTVTIDSYAERRQNFGMVDSAYCRIVDNETGKEVARFNLGEDFSAETALVIGELYRYNGEWNFKAIGQGFSGGLLALCNNYGLAAEYR